MFKTKLQELCQKRSWSLPEYSTTKQGLDHNPSFSATILVNDQSFQTSLYKSSKEAQNDAARLAFDHFSLPNPNHNPNPNPNPNSRPLIPSPSSFPQPSLLSPSGSSSGSVAINQMDGVHGTGETLQQQIQETQQTPPAGDGTSIVQGDNKIKDMIPKMNIKRPRDPKERDLKKAKTGSLGTKKTPPVTLPLKSSGDEEGKITQDANFDGQIVE